MPQTRTRTLSDAPHDVLYIIFRYLEPAQSHDTRGVASQSDVPPTSWLLDIALSCKSLSIHALDVLWHTLPSDEPLLRLLDTLDLEVSSPVTFGEEPTSVVRSVRSYGGADDTKSKWARFQSYARRVRKITLNPFHDRPPFWSRFSVENVCLRSLHTVEVYGIYNQGNVDTSFLNLVPNSTRTLIFRVFSQPEDTLEIVDRYISQSVLAILKDLCTRLQDLGTVTIRLPPGEPLDLESLFISHRLLSITVIEPKLTLNGFRPLCAGRSLTSLSFNMLSDAATPITPLVFKSIRSLALQGSWNSIHAALASLVIPRVCTIQLVVNYPRHASLNDDMTNCCADLASGRFPALDDIRFVLQEPRTLNLPPGSLIMRPACSLRLRVSQPFTVPTELLQLRGLRTISIRYFLPYLTFTCAPDALHQLAQAWSSLENLCLDFHESRRGEARGCSLPSLGTTLVALAEHCPHLKTVQLPTMGYDDGAMERAEAYAAGRGAVHELQELKVRRMGHPYGKEKFSARELALLVFPRADFVVNEISMRRSG